MQSCSAESLAGCHDGTGSTEGVSKLSCVELGNGAGGLNSIDAGSIKWACLKQ